MSEILRLTRHGCIAQLEICRPKVLNAIDGEVCDGLIHHVGELEVDPDVKVLILSGAGERAFSSGADLSQMRALSGATLRRFIEKTWIAFDTVARAPFASIAALHGYVLGGGAELALACDIRVAAADLAFGFPEMVLGSLPGSGAMQRLPGIVGHGKALELVSLGERLGADEALRLGLVSRLAPVGEALSVAMALAEEFAARPAESLRYAKLALRLGDDPRIAGAVHGLVSSVRQADPGYRDGTSRFDHVGKDRR